MTLTLSLPLLLLLGANGTEPVNTPQEPDATESKWTGSADFGYTFVSGNNESTSAAFNFEMRYDADWYQWLLNANYAGVRTTDPVTGDAATTSRLYRAGAQYNRFLDEEKNLYAYGNANIRKDVPVGLDLRWTVGGGAGYTWYFSEDNSTLFSLEAGPAFVHEENVGSSDDVDALNARAAARYENPLWTDWLLTSNGEFLQSLDETEDQSFTGEIAMRWDVRADWFFKASAAVSWDNTPAAGFESTDRIFVLSVGHSF